MTAASGMWSAQSRLDREGPSRQRGQASDPCLGVHLRRLWAPVLHTPPPHTQVHTPCKGTILGRESALTQTTRLLTAVNSRVTEWLLLRLSVASDPNTDPLAGPCRPQDVKCNVGGQVIQTDGNSGLNGTRNRSKPDLLPLTS